MSNESFKIVSINVGQPQEIEYKSKLVKTSIFKKPVDQVYLYALNFDGDLQSDLVNHGGPNKAVCVYSYDHYPFWEKELGKELTIGAFGENITLEGITEEDVHIGDTFQLGEAIIQVSQPRQPCFKLAMKWGTPELTQRVQQTGYTGFYFRVLQEGWVSKEDQLKVLDRHPKRVSVAAANHVKYVAKDNVKLIAELLSVEELSESWRKSLSERLT